MEQDIYAGAGDGFVFIASDGGGDEHNAQCVILSPEGAEKLAGELPRLSQLARNLKEAGEDYVGQVPDGTLNQMAAKLLQYGYTWKGGWWSRKGEDYVGQPQPYPQATVKAFNKINKNGGSR